MEIYKNDRVLIVKLETENKWRVVSNPVYGLSERGMSQMLVNYANDYVECRNCGVIHRMIRYENLADYGLKKKDVSKSHTLPQITIEGLKC